MERSKATEWKYLRGDLNCMALLEGRRMDSFIKKGLTMSSIANSPIIYQ